MEKPPLYIEIMTRLVNWIIDGFKDKGTGA